MSNKPKFPFRIITTWAHPSEEKECQACKKHGHIYTLENYIDMYRLIDKTAITKLTNDPWITAINSQAREQFDVTLSNNMCVSCLSELHVTSHGDTETWQKLRFLLDNKHGEVAFVYFIEVNDYEDEGTTIWFLCPITDSILDVADFVEQVQVESHVTRHTTPEDTQGAIRDITKFAKRHGMPVKIIKKS